MAAYTKFFDYAQQVNKAVHNWSTHTFKLLLSSVAPVQTNAVKADLTEITAGNGYPAGGLTMDNVTLSISSGTAKVTITDEVLTASGGTIAAFRYASLYNDTPTSPADPLVAFWDRGSSITLDDTDSATFDFDGTNGVWQFA